MDVDINNFIVSYSNIPIVRALVFMPLLLVVMSLTIYTMGILITKTFDRSVIIIWVLLLGAFLLITPIGIKLDEIVYWKMLKGGGGIGFVLFVGAYMIERTKSTKE